MESVVDGQDFILIGDEIRYPCERCGRTYRFKRDMRTHIKYECGMEPRFHCPHCSYRSKRKGDLRAHIAIKHLQIITTYFDGHISAEDGLVENDCGSRFACHRCGRSYRQKYNLNVHQKYECAFPNSNSLVGEELGGDDENVEAMKIRFRCDRCGKSYSRRKTLNFHQRYECGVDPKFQCPYCAHKAKRRADLRKHVGLRHSVPIQ
ncbi:hypothetical protein LSTR_LSTR000960 [Laodelphax striatellus]|uniref:C2H2-type domain-containing protein n=1 Tax=Laodelphax striatellus TaxID=195883 RepID=A0A482X0U3_LAOST|nr:hypothetical protein LSTR_LSTR000960 [Laodelphax striatellus]